MTLFVQPCYSKDYQTSTLTLPVSRAISPADLAWFPSETKQGLAKPVPGWETSWGTLMLPLEVVFGRPAGGVHHVVLNAPVL